MTVAENGAFGVGVRVGVFVGGTSSNAVDEGSSVKVGKRVGVIVGVVSARVAVHVGWSCIGVVVGVGGASNSARLGGKGFNAEVGVTNIKTKYPPRQSVTSRIRMLSKSHTSRREPFFGAGVPL